MTFWLHRRKRRAVGKTLDLVWAVDFVATSPVAFVVVGVAGIAVAVVVVGVGRFGGRT